MNRDKGNKVHVIFRPRQIPDNGLVIVGGGLIIAGGDDESKVDPIYNLALHFGF